MSFLDFLSDMFASPTPAPSRRGGGNVWASEATRVMRGLNSNALVAEEAGFAVFIEERWDSDSDRRLYKLEYRSTFDGRHAIAFCLKNPWSNGGGPNAGVEVTKGHVFSDGLLCLNSQHTRSPERSSMDLKTVVQRSRYWTVAFSVLKETGSFPNP